MSWRRKDWDKNPKLNKGHNWARKLGSIEYGMQNSTGEPGKREPDIYRGKWGRSSQGTGKTGRREMDTGPFV